LSGTENRIGVARKRYNDALRTTTRLCFSFPTASGRAWPVSTQNNAYFEASLIGETGGKLQAVAAAIFAAIEKDLAHHAFDTEADQGISALVRGQFRRKSHFANNIAQLRTADCSEDLGRGFLIGKETHFNSSSLASAAHLKISQTADCRGRAKCFLDPGRGNGESEWTE
jgi:hypothetical protein